MNTTPLFIIEMNELQSGSQFTAETVEKFHLGTLRKAAGYTLYHSHETGNAYLVYNTTIMAIGPSFVLEPFMDVRTNIETLKASLTIGTHQGQCIECERVSIVSDASHLCEACTLDVQIGNDGQWEFKPLA